MRYQGGQTLERQRSMAYMLTWSIESQYRNSISIEAGLYHLEITGTQVHQILQAAMRSNREFRRMFIEWAERLDKAPEGAIQEEA